MKVQPTPRNFRWNWLHPSMTMVTDLAVWSNRFISALTSVVRLGKTPTRWTNERRKLNWSGKQYFVGRCGCSASWRGAPRSARGWKARANRQMLMVDSFRWRARQRVTRISTDACSSLHRVEGACHPGLNRCQINRTPFTIKYFANSVAVGAHVPFVFEVERRPSQFPVARMQDQKNCSGASEYVYACWSLSRCTCCSACTTGRSFAVQSCRQPKKLHKSAKTNVHERLTTASTSLRYFQMGEVNFPLTPDIPCAGRTISSTRTTPTAAPRGLVCLQNSRFWLVVA